MNSLLNFQTADITFRLVIGELRTDVFRLEEHRWCTTQKKIAIVLQHFESEMNGSSLSYNMAWWPADYIRKARIMGTGKLLIVTSEFAATTK
ncbi:hypothetical protein EGX59_21415 [Escherichia coli]|nr:hypothetical protein [Escherichia coli]EFN7727495.1 hypothetical protein [Escherichia coli]EFN7773946.1 hypothetical protein [Escherichia coli]EFN7826068.1 hypothetical protein [Escherichia coli]EFN8484122.1 hypothetical protein [Escherichia coli]